MKKSLLFVGAIMSSQLAMAAPGDAVNGGTGTINVSGTVTSGTCSVSIDNPNHSFTINRTEAMTKGSGEEITRVSSNIAFTNCGTGNFSMSITGTPLMGDAFFGSFNEYETLTNQPARYQIFVQGTGVTGGSGQNPLQRILKTDASNAVTLPAASTDLKLSTAIQRTGSNAQFSEDTLTATYTYNITYM